MLRIGPLFGVIQYVSSLFQYIATPLSAPKTALSANRCSLAAALSRKRRSIYSTSRILF